MDDALKARFEAVAQITATEATHMDEAAAWPEKTMRALQADGLAGLVVPTEFGGLGEGLSTMLEACEILGRESASAGLCFGMHCVGTAVIAAKATPDQAERYLKPIARGEHITTLALSEPGTGAHFYYPQSSLKRVDGGFELSGTKSFSTNGGHADSYVVSTLAPEEAPAGLFSCVMVPGDDRLKWGSPFEGLGMRGNSSRTFSMADVFIPDNDVIGEQGDQIWYIFHVVAPFFLVSMAGSYLGVAQRAVDEARQHLAARDYDHNGGGPRYEPVVQHRMGQIWASVERTRRFAYWAAREAETGGSDAMPALCSAKAEVADCVVDVCNEAMTVMGGVAYRDSHIMSRLLRDARASHVMSPTTDLLRTWTGRAVLDIPVLSDA